MDRGVVLLASGASATLHVPCILHSFACMSLHFPFIYSVHFHSNVHSCPFIFLSFACMFLSFCIHVLSFVEMALWLGQGTECNKWLSLRLSLKKPSNIWHCSKEMYHKNDRVRQRERERASSMPNAMVTAGNRAPQVEFLSSVLPVLWMCITVFVWLTPSLMDCRVWSQVIAFWGDLSLYRVSCISLTKKLRQYQSGLQPFWPWLMWIVWWWIVLACIIFIYWAPWKLLPVRHCTSLSLLGIIVMPYVLAVVQILGKNFLCGCGPQFIFWPWSL